MNYAFWTVIALCALVCAASSVTWSVVIARRLDYHRGKMDAFQEVANDLQLRGKQAGERTRLLLRLCLCDENICRALDAALSVACEHWGYSRKPILVGSSDLEDA